MNFIRYDRKTGELLGYGYMPSELVQEEIDAGKGTLFVENLNDPTNWKVNLSTKTLERIAPEVSIAVPPDAFSIPNHE